MTAASLVPDAVACATLDAIRAEIAAAPFKDYWIADRGKYRFNDSLALPEFFATLTQLAEARTGLRTSALAFRWTRHRHGDYAQPKDDDRFWAGRRAIDLTLDLSAAASDEGQVVWFDAARSLVLPQTPGTLALVVRDAPLARYERYLTHRIGAAEVFRLRLVLSVESRAA
ncbi:MAG TPA: hypothetical protein VFF06_06750 [Polyangia bacterium]|nr:hypothetical protein [Polyangia bacterium]